MSLIPAGPYDEPAPSESTFDFISASVALFDDSGANLVVYETDAGLATFDTPDPKLAEIT
jgi:hypothetical protein